jgi:rubrerythrin
MLTLRTILLSSLVVLMLITFGTVANATDIPNSETLQRLQVAYSTEMNAFERYRAFAEKADSEGYAGVAILFRAVARSEQIQYTNLIDAIRQLGFAPQATGETPIIESTKENLQTAVNKSEGFDRENLYPLYIKRAKAEGNPYGAKILDNLKQGEAQNARLFKTALKSMDQMKRAGTGYFVCASTAFVATAIDAGHCVGSDWELEK